MVKIKEHLKLLGINKLKPQQKDIINNFLKGNDTLGILPTGFGKSICYILPHLITQKNVIVISPLISLMEDQHISLEEKNINSILFNSNNHKIFSKKGEIGELTRVQCGDIKGLLYFSPESFIKREELVRELIQNNNVCLIAVDEAHCIDTWSDFRCSYTNLCCIRNYLKVYKKNIPLLALTATATQSTAHTIIKTLKLIKPSIIKCSFYRNNLRIFIQKKDKYDLNIRSIIQLIKNKKTKTLIYCKTIEDTEKISNSLVSNGIDSMYYHGQMSPKNRKSSQDYFSEIDNNTKVMVATIAFGMGINIPDIHLIIHYGISKDIESYYQEIGRGGRDGIDTDCYLYWSKKDFQTNRYFLNQIKSNTFRMKQMKRTIEIEKLIYDNKCRMKMILSYFNETDFDKCNNCDNCLKNNSVCYSDSDMDSQKDNNSINSVNKIYIYFIFKTLDLLGYGCGSNTLVSILTGNESKTKQNMKILKTFGSLKDMDIPKKRKILSEYIRIIHYEGYLTEKKLNNIRGSYLELNDLSKKWLNKNSINIKKSLNILSKFSKNIKERYKNRIKEKSIFNKNICENNKIKTIKGSKKYIDLLERGSNIAFIMKEFNVKEQTVLNNIYKILNENPEMRLNWENINGPNKEKIIEIYKGKTNWTSGKYRDLKDILSRNISYNDIYLALTPQGEEIYKQNL